MSTLDGDKWAGMRNQKLERKQTFALFSFLLSLVFVPHTLGRRERKGEDRVQPQVLPPPSETEEGRKTTSKGLCGFVLVQCAHPEGKERRKERKYLWALIPGDRGKRRKSQI